MDRYRYASEHRFTSDFAPAPPSAAPKSSGPHRMNIADLLGPGRVLVNVRVRDKSQLLLELARRAAPLAYLEEDTVYEALRQREQLGSTGVGRGIALPHARVPGLQTLFGMFVRLSRPIDFQSVDEKPVDLVFLLLIPPEAGSEHVAALAAISRRVREPAFAERLRTAVTSEAALMLFTGE